MMLQHDLYCIESVISLLRQSRGRYECDRLPVHQNQSLIPTIFEKHTAVRFAFFVFVSVLFFPTTLATGVYHFDKLPHDLINVHSQQNQVLNIKLQPEELDDFRFYMYAYQ